ncbi:LLM class oxidoreductase [Corynebacterium sp. MSK039]|uniref:LLM class oxidoreductase n=1 Tax=Corynebacterium sp. MSK039 TaxID=3050193 RepID=UPI00254DE886|nr:LLM class oxidoreductase [Corynebacterium sp. MSK039]MDK8791945.1 LLM class oxidoreductase [Corynebacterium sp. MSK039]
MTPLRSISDTPITELPGYQRNFAPGRLSVGLSLPIGRRDNERPTEVASPAGSGSSADPAADLAEQLRLIRLAEDGGFSAVWARDIPLSVETFGDDGQVYDPWMYLSYIAAQTSTIALGTAAIVVPFQHPLLMAKRAASLDRLSGGRFLMGIATGDRPEEFPAFNQEQGARDERFREHLAVYTKALRTSMRPIRWSEGKVGGAEVLPKPTAHHVPVLATGSCQQSLEWKAEHTDGWFMYHKGLAIQQKNVDQWREAVVDACGEGAFKPFLEAMWIDLHEDPDAPAQGGTFGYRLGRNTLVSLLNSQREIGINHVSINLLGSTHRAGEQIEEIAEHVLPKVTG